MLGSRHASIALLLETQVMSSQWEKGISELRIDYGPGYRIYFQKCGTTVIVLLCGGDKSSQAMDIKIAKRLLQEWSEDDG